MAPQPQEFEGKTNLEENLPKSAPETVTVESVSETDKSDNKSKMPKRVNPFTPSTPEGVDSEVPNEPGLTAIGMTDVKSGTGEGNTGHSEGKSGISEGKTGAAEGKTAGKTEGKTGITEGRKRTKSVDTEIPLEIGNTMKGITESIPETVNGIPQPLNGNPEVTSGIPEGRRTVPRRRSMRKITVEGMSNGNANGNEPSTPDKNVDKNGNQNPDFDDKMLDFDDVLPHMGEFGLYQKLLFVLLAPFAFFVAFVYFTQIFITLTPEEHWCRVPGLDHFNLSLYDRLHLTIPRSAVNRHVFDKCLQYDVNFTEVLSAGVTEPQPEWRVVPCRNGWDFNYTDVPYTTIASELGWVCENAALGSIAQAVFFFGAILGGLIFGWMADHYGRIPALVGTNVIGLVAGCATALCNSFWAFCVCRFLVGLAFDNCFTMMYILVLEYVGPKWRTFVANMSIAMYFTLASCLLPWMAYWIADWRWLCVATSAPLALAIITPWIVPESARWLVSQGKIDKALVIMKKFEKINGTKVDPQIYKQFTESCYKIQKEEEADKSYSVLDLFRSPRLRNITLLLIAIWMAISLCFDGHVRNVGSLGLDLFVTFTVAAATELPADTLLTLVLDRWGRRWLACGSMCMSGIFSLLAATVPPGAASASLAIMGRFSVNISYNIGLQYAAELLPTVVRAQGVALIHIMGYVASILAPFIVLLAVISPGLPLVVLGSLGVVGGLLSLFLPETLDKELPQTLQDGENFGRGQRMLDFPCCNKRIEEDPPVVPTFRRRSYGRASARASIRGATYRSTMIQRSTRQRHAAAAENNAACNT